MVIQQLKRSALLLILGLLLHTPAHAQSPLQPNVPVSGTVAGGGSNDWNFTGYAGEVVSLLVEGEGDFDPVLTLLDTNGRTIVSNDDYNYPESRNSLLEAITLSRTDTYTARISGFGDAAGDYNLRLLPGFSRVYAEDSFEGETNWRAADNNLNVRARTGQLEASLGGTRQTGIILNNQLSPVGDFYAGVEVANVEGEGGWVVGMVARREGSSYYLLEIDHRGLWRFSLNNGSDVSVVRDWTPHPNIRPGETRFTFGMMLKGAGVDVFYNGGFVGSTTADTLSMGQVGLVAGTTAAQTGETIVQFDNFIITVPYSESPIIPQQIVVGDGNWMVQSLKRNHVVSPAGEMVLTVPEVSVEYARPGIQRLMVGRGTRYTNFALGATVNIQGARRGLTGCGLVIRFTTENDYTLAFVDQSGGYGISQRSGSNFLPGTFGENGDWAATTYHLLMIADENTLYYYIDGNLAGTLENTAQAGEVGTAVVNYESINTACRFSNLWLWRW